MIKLGVDVNKSDKYLILFIIVCNEGKMCFVKVLLKVGLGVN